MVPWLGNTTWTKEDEKRFERYEMTLSVKD